MAWIGQWIMVSLVIDGLDQVRIKVGGTPLRKGANDTPVLSAVSLLEGVTVEGDTAFHVVATHGDGHNFLRCAKLIYGKAKHLLLQPNGKGDTPLHCAVRAGNSQMVSQLIDLASQHDRSMDSSDDKTVKDLLRKENHSKETALHEAVRFGDIATVKKLLTYDSGLARFPQEGTSSLYLSIMLDKNVIARTLRDMSEENVLSYTGPNGQNALHAAVLRRKEMTDMLLKWNKSLSEQRDNDGSTPLHFAHFNQTMKDRYPFTSLRLQDNRGYTALHSAVEHGYLRIVCSLLGNKQVFLNLTDKNGQTPLDIARSKIPTGNFYGWVIYFISTLVFVFEKGTYKKRYIMHSSVPVQSMAAFGGIDFKRSIYPPKTSEDESKESQILSDSTQTLAIGAVLVATVTFGATFALPGGYRADDHINGGTPTLAGRYTFDAFIMATTLAFICSSIATLDLMYSGIPMVNLPVRRKHFAVSVFFLTSSTTSLVAAFALGVYMVLAPVDRNTGIAICVINPFVVLYRNKGRLQDLCVLAAPLYIRMGLWASFSLTKDILSGVLLECWPLIIIFGWAGYTTYCRHHR
ncbi:hypothetical protein ABZP36_035564 [Zizania latifolia]